MSYPQLFNQDEEGDAQRSPQYHDASMLQQAQQAAGMGAMGSGPSGLWRQGMSAGGMGGGGMHGEMQGGVQGMQGRVQGMQGGLQGNAAMGMPSQQGMQGAMGGMPGNMQAMFQQGLSTGNNYGGPPPFVNGVGSGSSQFAAAGGAMGGPEGSGGQGYYAGDRTSESIIAAAMAASNNAGNASYGGGGQGGTGGGPYGGGGGGGGGGGPYGGGGGHYGGGGGSVVLEAHLDMYGAAPSGGQQMPGATLPSLQNMNMFAGAPQQSYPPSQYTPPQQQYQQQQFQQSPQHQQQQLGQQHQQQQLGQQQFTQQQFGQQPQHPSSQMQGGWMSQNAAAYNAVEQGPPWHKSQALAAASSGGSGGPDHFAAHEQMRQMQMPGGWNQQQQQQLAQNTNYEEEQPKRRSSSLSSSGSMQRQRRPSLGHTAMFANQQHQQKHNDDTGQGQVPVIGKIPLIIPSGVPTDADLRANANRKEKNKSKKRAKTFPEKLMQGMVDQAGNDGDAVAWLPDGKSFVVVSPDLFCNRILANVFKESKYASFVRKLHRWGFVRLTSGTGTDCFSHPLFQRNRKDMCARIVCTPRDKDGNLRGYSGKNEKPPSLAGVEKFIRAKIAAAAAAAVPSTGALPPLPSGLLTRVLPPGAPRPPLASSAEVGGAAPRTNPARMNGVPTAETDQAFVASYSPQMPSQQETEESNQSASGAPQLPASQGPTVVTASDSQIPEKFS